jgi:hypothetical protein
MNPVHIPIEFTQQVLFCEKNKYTNCTVTNAYASLLFVHLLKIIGFSKLVEWECNAQCAGWRKMAMESAEKLHRQSVIV